MLLLPSSKAVLLKSSLTGAEKKRYKCESCNKSYSQKCSLYSHIAHVHSNRNMAIICMICRKQFKNSKCFVQHIKKFHREKLHCKLCFQLFSSQNDLLQHRMHTCDGSYSTAGLEARAAVGNPVRYYCQLCSKSYSHKRNLDSHYKIAHVSEDLRVTCAICTKVCKNKRSLTDHLRHNHPGIFKCKKCLKLFLTLKDLNEHKLQEFCT
ncbi:hypothetical protein B566_EDAN018147 [Ephemera danica]|nr:hypothetical protein B566_EDAN018147 [Ephemera danica]